MCSWRPLRSIADLAYRWSCLNDNIFILMSLILFIICAYLPIIDRSIFCESRSGESTRWVVQIVFGAWTVLFSYQSLCPGLRLDQDSLIVHSYVSVAPIAMKTCGRMWRSRDSSTCAHLSDFGDHNLVFLVASCSGIGCCMRRWTLCIVIPLVVDSGISCTKMLIVLDSFDHESDGGWRMSLHRSGGRAGLRGHKRLTTRCRLDIGGLSSTLKRNIPATTSPFFDNEIPSSIVFASGSYRSILDDLLLVNIKLLRTFCWLLLDFLWVTPFFFHCLAVVNRSYQALLLFTAPH